MIKLLLVDDEEYTRFGIRSMLPWNDLGIGEVRLADDGQNGLEEARAFQPDIVMTDVKMPRMDGISMVAGIREFLPDCRAIFMSGYSDREFLKSAIELSAIRYVDKPIDLPELREAVENAVESVRSHRAARDKSRVQEQQLQTSIPALKNQIALSLLHRSTVGAALNCLNIALPGLNRDGPYCTLLLALYGADEARSLPGGVMIQTLRDLVESRLTAEGHFSLAGCKDDALLAVHLCTCTQNGEPLGLSGLETLCRRLAQTLESICQVTIACGPVVNGLLNVCDSYTGAAVAFQRAFYHGPGAVVQDTPEQPQTAAHPLGQEALLQFSRLLRPGGREACAEWVQTLSDALRTQDRTPVPQAKSFYARLAALLVRGEAPQPDFTAVHFLSHLERLLLELLDCYFAALNAGESCGDVGNRVIAHIREHYADPALSLASLAQEFGLSPSYLSALFKKDSGENLTHYITKYRVCRAQEALRDPERRVKSIALETGFSDYNYFIKVFKKYAGMTPLEYRQLSAANP